MDDLLHPPGIPLFEHNSDQSTVVPPGRQASMDTRNSKLPIDATSLMQVKNEDDAKSCQHSLKMPGE